PSGRLTIDAGARVDSGSGHAGPTPSVRAGLRYAVDEAGVTVVKAGDGSFVSSVPLAAEGDAGYPQRTEIDLDAATGETISTLVFQPTFESLHLPRAATATFEVERQLTPRVDMQIAFTHRHTTRMATLRVPAEGGPIPVRSDGSSVYRDVE